MALRISHKYAPVIWTMKYTCITAFLHPGSIYAVHPLKVITRVKPGYVYFTYKFLFSYFYQTGIFKMDDATDIKSIWFTNMLLLGFDAVGMERKLRIPFNK